MKLLNNLLQDIKNPMVTSKANMCFCYWLLSNVDQKKAENFLDKIFNGTQLREKTIEKNNS